VSKADELRLLREAIKSFPDAVAIWSAEGELIACSDLYARLGMAPGGAAGEFQSEGRHLRRTLRRLQGGARLELVSDITDLRRAEQAARFLAYHDAATGLPNRRLLDDRLRQAIRLAQRRDRMVGVVLVRLEDAERLPEVAQRLAGCVRKADTVARIGADQFALVLSDLKDEADCRAIADKVAQALADARPGVGVSLYPSDGADAEALLRNADAAILFFNR
jgi:diguanylate cyclase (GGDEF)-like protein